MKKIIKLSIAVFCFCYLPSTAQELYVFSEPASNMPAHSLSLKQTAKGLRNTATAGFESRHTTEAMFGFNKNLMMHAAVTFSDMYSSNLKWESARLYAKYRFLSSDAMFSHFRMAAFGEASYSQNKPYYDELSLEGDQSGVQFGVIATQLLHKLAISTTLSITESLQNERWSKQYPPSPYPYEAFNYSLSAGYLILPKKYTDYKQTNLNFYAELIGQKSLDQQTYFVDLAPAAQLIFNSTAKLNFGYRFQLGSNMNRMSAQSWLLSFEWIFLDALK